MSAPISMQACVAALRAELAGADFVAATELDGPTARIRFIGHFQDEEVVWDAHLVALAETVPEAPQFLDIGRSTARGVPIRIGLNVPRIDRPTVMKTLIMVRNYKLLRAGRHEFGPHGPAALSRANIRSGE